jgi:phosphoglucomutase
MPVHPLAGKPAPADILIDVAALERAYYANKPDLGNPTQLVAFGTSGHRGTPFDGSFTESHILATTQAICDYRRSNRITGPLFMGKDSHAASDPAQRTALEVLAANGIETLIQRDTLKGAAGSGNAPTPVISRAILAYNRGRSDGLARPRTIRRPTAASSTIRPRAVQPILTSRNGFKIAPTICCGAAIRM